MNGSQEGHNGFEGIASGCVLLAAASYLASHLAILIGLPFIWVEDETRVLPIILILLSNSALHVSVSSRVDEEVVDLFHEVINASVIVVPNPPEEVVDGFFQGVFEVRSKASSLRANRPQGARVRIKTNETVGSHEKVPVPPSTFVYLHLAVSQAEILFRVLEERFNAPPHPIGADHVLSWCVDFVRGEVLDQVLFVFICFFLGDDQFHVSQLGDGKLFRPDVIGVVLDVALNRVDALCQRIDAEFFAGVGHLPIAPKRADPVLAVRFDLFGKVRIVSEPRVEEVGVPADTYPFFEFSTHLSGQIVFGIVVVVLVVLLFVEAECEWIGGFVVSAEGVDEVLAPDSVIFGVIVEPTDAGNFVPGFLGDRVVKDDVAIFRPARFTVFL